MISASFYDRIWCTQIIRVTQLWHPDFACFLLKRFKRSSRVNIWGCVEPSSCFWILIRKDGESVMGASWSLLRPQRRMKISCVTMSVEMSHSVVWGNLWSQDCNISTEWRKTVFHLIPTALLNSCRPYEPHSPTEAAPISKLLLIKGACVLSGWLGWTFVSRDHQHTRTHTKQCDL